MSKKCNSSRKTFREQTWKTHKTKLPYSTSITTGFPRRVEQNLKFSNKQNAYWRRTSQIVISNSLVVDCKKNSRLSSLTANFFSFLSLSRMCDVTFQLLFFGARKFSARVFKTLRFSSFHVLRANIFGFRCLFFLFLLTFLFFHVDFCDVCRSKSNDNQTCLAAELEKKKKKKQEKKYFEILLWT